MARYSEEAKTTTDPSLFRKLQRKIVSKKTGKCDICPPHSGENTSWSKRGVKKRKGKNKRRL